MNLDCLLKFSNFCHPFHALPLPIRAFLPWHRIVLPFLLGSYLPRLRRHGMHGILLRKKHRLYRSVGAALFVCLRQPILDCPCERVVSAEELLVDLRQPNVLSAATVGVYQIRVHVLAAIARQELLRD